MIVWCGFLSLGAYVLPYSACFCMLIGMREVVSWFVYEGACVIMGLCVYLWGFIVLCSEGMFT